jgi:3' terminal RNA ribose 2'-O-methyltransferase Hen1
MLLTISTNHRPATELGYLLHKHPDRFQTFDLSFGQAHVFYPEVSAERTTLAMLLDVDPVSMVRSKSVRQGFLLGKYVNDRPYVASSFMSVAISQVLGTALGGRCKERPELVGQAIPLVSRIEVLPVRTGGDFARQVFEPLGYTVEAVRHPLDERFPEWGESPYYSVTISGLKTLSELLTHLYVLIPVFDNGKHYYVGDDEVEKLLAKGAGWLAQRRGLAGGAPAARANRPPLPAASLEPVSRGARPADRRGGRRSGRTGPRTAAGGEAGDVAEPQRTAACRRAGGAEGQRRQECARSGLR